MGVRTARWLITTTHVRVSICWLPALGGHAVHCGGHCGEGRVYGRTSGGPGLPFSLEFSRVRFALSDHRLVVTAARHGKAETSWWTRVHIVGLTYYTTTTTFTLT